MKTPKLMLSLLFSTCLLLAGCNDRPVDPASSDTQETKLNLEASNFELDNLAPSKDKLQTLLETAKKKRGGKSGIAHYRFDVRLGSGPYDVVRIHRVIKEGRPFGSNRSKGSVFMVAGSNQGFSDIFLNAGTKQPDPGSSVAYYMASKGIDVWGVDLGWSLISPETDDFTFMKNWGLAKDAEHTLAALSIARFFRLLSGQGLDRMHLLGFSYGAAVAYTAAGMETQQHRWGRDIKGIIPVDFAYKLDNVKLRQLSCQAAESFRGQMAEGIYVNDRSGLAGLGYLALNDPDGSSPVFPGLTNYQAPLFVALNPRPVSGWHFLGGSMDMKQPAFDLYHTTPTRWFRLVSSTSPYMPKETAVDLEETRCGNKDVPFDDRLRDISLPILYIGAIGGDGEEGYYTTTLTSSRDITTHTVEGKTPGMEDYGHADLFMAENAPELVWEGLNDWIISQERTRRDTGGGTK